MVSMSDFTTTVQVHMSASPRIWLGPGAAWTDLSSFVRMAEPITCQRGRSNEFDAQAQPGTASWQFRNSDGRFTVGNSSSPYAPVQIRRQCRVRVAYGAFTYELWRGLVDSWGSGRDQTLGVARVKASDRLARSGQALPAALIGEMLTDSPSVLYPLGDAEFSTTAGDVSGNSAASLSVSQVGSGGSVDFGAGEAPGPDVGTVAAFTRSNATNGKRLLSPSSASLPLTGSTSGHTIEAVVRPSSASAQMSAARTFFATVTYVDLGVSSTGKARVVFTDGDTVGVTTLTGTTTLPTSSPTHLAVTMSAPSGGSITARLYVNGVQEATTTFSLGNNIRCNAITVGGHSGGDMWDGQISHVASYRSELSAARVAAHADGLDGWTGETSGDRFTRLCRIAGLSPLVGVGTTVVGTPAATMGPQPTKGKPLLTALREVAEAELGVVYVAADGVLTFATRETRYNAPVALTLYADRPGHVGGDFEVNTDDALICNDYTVERIGGATQRVVDQASVDAYDTAAESAALYVGTDDQALTAAQWRVNTTSEPQPRPSSLTVDVVAFANSGGNVAALLGIEVGARVQVRNLPADVTGSTTLDVFVEGVRWVIDKNSIKATLTASPIGAAGAVFILDDATYGALDGVGVLAL